MAIRATDDPELAKELGFTKWDEDRQQFVPGPHETEETEEITIPEQEEESPTSGIDSLL